MELDFKKIKTATKTSFENIKITVCLPFVMIQVTGFFKVLFKFYNCLTALLSLMQLNPNSFRSFIKPIYILITPQHINF